MNILVIILGVIIVFLVYYIYVLYTYPPIIASNIYLMNTVPAIPATSITKPNTSIYTIGVWVYINTFSQNIQNFVRYGNNVNNGTASPYLFSLSMEQNSPVLYATVGGNNGTGTGVNVTNKIPITNNFPIQSWVYVTVSVSTYYADCYINGKLVVSSKLVYPSASTNADDSPTFTFLSGVDVFLTQLSRWSYPMDPQTVWNYYQKGNGNPNESSMLPSYSLSATLSQGANVVAPTAPTGKNWTWKIF